MDAIYARQSVDKKDSISIEGQIELCRKECSGKVKEYSDKGYSGKNTDRPDFQRMMAAVQRGEIEKIVVYRLDRISRSISDFGRIWEILKAHNTEFISVNEKFDTSTPVGRAMVYIIMVFAQLERETIAERIKDNYYQRAKRGAFLGGPAPFGFTITRTTIADKAASMLVPDGNIEIVKQIFNKYAYSGMSLSKIAAWLTEQGVPGIGRKTWDNVSISRILHNPVYVKADADIYYFYYGKGLIMYNGIEDFTGKKALWLWGKRDRNAAKYTDLHDQLIAIAGHDGIIDSQTFLTCQNKLGENKQIKNTGSGKYTWLSGLLKCANCGYSMRVVCSQPRAGSKKYCYFSCSGKSNMHICDIKHSESIEDVENQAADQIQAEIDRIAVQDVPDQQIDTHNAEKIELAKINEQIGNLMDRLEEANDVTMRYINQRLTELDERKSTLLDIISTIPRRPQTFLPDCPFSKLDFDGKKSVAQMLVDRVEASPNGVTVFFK